MKDLLTGADSFAHYLRFQLFKKNKQTFKKEVYSQKIWGSQIKGGLEVCDYILLEYDKGSFEGVSDLIACYKSLKDLFKKELLEEDLSSFFLKYSNEKTKERFGIKKKDKIYALNFKSDIKKAVLRGGYVACLDLLYQDEKKPTDNIEILLGDVHIIRMNYWNTYRLGDREKQLRKVDVNDTMKVNPGNLTLS